MFCLNNKISALQKMPEECGEDGHQDEHYHRLFACLLNQSAKNEITKQANLLNGLGLLEARTANRSALRTPSSSSLVAKSLGRDLASEVICEPVPSTEELTRRRVDQSRVLRFSLNLNLYLSALSRLQGRERPEPETIISLRQSAQKSAGKLLSSSSFWLPTFRRLECVSLSSRCIVRTDLTRYRTMRSFCLHFGPSRSRF